MQLPENDWKADLKSAAIFDEYTWLGNLVNGLLEPREGFSASQANILTAVYSMSQAFWEGDWVRLTTTDITETYGHHRICVLS